MIRIFLLLLLIIWHGPATAQYQSEPGSGIKVIETERLPDQSLIEVRIEQPDQLSSVGGSTLILRAVCQLTSLRGFKHALKLEENTSAAGVTRMRFGFSDSADASAAANWPEYAGQANEQDGVLSESFCADIEKLISASCVIQPPFLSFTLPEKGFEELTSGERCALNPDQQWRNFSDQDSSLRLNAEGPGGSGRYWIIRLGLLEQGEEIPGRGVCIETSTAGWRTLQQYDNTPLPWSADLSHDGANELVLWSSFFLRYGQDHYDPGLVAWVYRLEDKDRFSLDRELTANLALDVAAAYRQPLPGKQALQKRRDGFAAKLEVFAGGNCVSAPRE